MIIMACVNIAVNIKHKKKLLNSTKFDCICACIKLFVFLFSEMLREKISEVDKNKFELTRGFIMKIFQLLKKIYFI